MARAPQQSSRLTLGGASPTPACPASTPLHPLRPLALLPTHAGGAAVFQFFPYRAGMVALKNKKIGKSTHPMEWRYGCFALARVSDRHTWGMPGHGGVVQGLGCKRRTGGHLLAMASARRCPHVGGTINSSSLRTAVPVCTRDGTRVPGMGCTQSCMGALFKIVSFGRGDGAPYSYCHARFLASTRIRCV